MEYQQNKQIQFQHDQMTALNAELDDIRFQNIKTDEE